LSASPCNAPDFRVDHACAAELHVDEGQAKIEAMVAHQDLGRRVGFGIPPAATVDHRGNPETIQVLDRVDERARPLVEGRLRDRRVHRRSPRTPIGNVNHCSQ
jgi:hypothetical protein